MWLPIKGCKCSYNLKPTNSILVPTKVAYSLYAIACFKTIYCLKSLRYIGVIFLNLASDTIHFFESRPSAVVQDVCHVTTGLGPEERGWGDSQTFCFCQKVLKEISMTFRTYYVLYFSCLVALYLQHKLERTSAHTNYPKSEFFHRHTLAPICIRTKTTYLIVNNMIPNTVLL